jgi:hypothetical protein
MVVAIQPIQSSQIGCKIGVRGAPSDPTVATVAHAMRATRAWNSAAISANEATSTPPTLPGHRALGLFPQLGYLNVWRKLTAALEGAPGRCPR